MTDSDPLTALHHWFAEDQEERRRILTDPGTDEGRLRVALSLHRLDEEGAVTLVRLVGELLDAPAQQRAAIEEWVGAPRLESLRRVAGQVDVDELARVRAAMRAAADDQAARGVADYATLSRQSSDLRGHVGDLRAIVGDIYGHLEEKAAQEQLRAIEQAARQVPGSNVRITETVAGPDGTHHVVRDVMAIGPDPELARVDVNYSLSSDRKLLLGLDDQRGAEIAGQQVQHVRATRALQVLGLPESATAAQVQDRAIHHLLTRSQVDAEIGDVLGNLPSGLVGLRPGHFPGLRASAQLILVDAIQDAAARGRRGDLVVAGHGNHMLLLGLALVHGSVFYLPTAAVASEATQRDEDVALPVGDLVVFHDRPLPLGPGAEAIAWVFTVADDGAVMGFAQVMLEAGDAETTGIELSNVNLARGEAAAVAARVLAAVARPGWQVTKKRKLPGRPGEKAWRDTLGRAAAVELRTGSLGAVHTRGPASVTV